MDSERKCPKCQAPGVAWRTVCPKCGQNLELFHACHGLRRRLTELQQGSAATAERLAGLETQLATFEQLLQRTLAPPEVKEEPAAVAPAAAAPEAAGAEEEVAATPSPAAAKMLAESVTPGLAELKVGQKGLLITGIVVMVLGIGYFLKYSFEQGWVTPAGRVAMSYLAGMLLLGGGEYARRKDYAGFGLNVIGGGIATLYFASFAGYGLYHLMPHWAAFGLMLLVTVLAGGLSIFYDAKWLAVLGLIGGFLTPAVLNTEVPQAALMGYMTMLNLGILWIAFFKRWGSLNYLGSAFTWLLFAGWFFRFYRNENFWPTMFFLNVFFLVYAMAPFVYYFVKSRREQLRGFAITIPNAFIAFGFSFAMIRTYASSNWASLVSVAYAILFLGMAQLLFRRRGGESTRAFVMLLSKASLFLAITVPLLFSGHWVTLFWAIEVAVLLWAGLRLRSKWVLGFASLLMLAVLFKLFAFDYIWNFRLDVDPFYFRANYFEQMFERWLTVAAVLAALAIFPLSCRRFPGGAGNAGKWAAAFLWAIFGVLVFVALNIEVAALFHDIAPTARFASISVLWTAFSIALLALGFTKKRAALRHTAMGLFLLTLIKVFMVDVARASTPFRIVSFLVLGIVLVGASFLYYHFTDRIFGDKPPTETES